MGNKLAKNKSTVNGCVIMEVLATALPKKSIFNKEDNFRDIETGYAKRTDLVRKLIEAGKVTNPVQVGIIGKTLEEITKMSADELLDAGLLPEQGFRRIDGACAVLDKSYDAMFPNASTEFSAYVPIMINVRENMGQVIKARADHSSQKGLTPIDACWMYKQMKEDPFNNYSDARCMFEMLDILVPLLSGKKTAEWEEKVANVKKDHSEHLWDHQLIQEAGDFFKGRRQDMQDAVMPKGPSLRDRLMENYRKKMIGNKTAIVYPRGMKIPKDLYERFEKEHDIELQVDKRDRALLVDNEGTKVEFMTTDALVDTYDKWYREAKEEKPTLRDTMWNVKKLTEQVKTHHDNPILLTVFNTILGDQSQKGNWQLFTPMLKKLHERFEENPANVEAFLNKEA